MMCCIRILDDHRVDSDGVQLFFESVVIVPQLRMGIEICDSHIIFRIHAYGFSFCTMILYVRSSGRSGNKSKIDHIHQIH